MEKMNGLQLDNIEAFKIATDQTIEEYCKQNNIDIDDIPPQIWNDIIDELKFKIFLPNKKYLKVQNNVNNEYDINRLYEVYIYIYKRICNKHKKEITLKGYCELLDIHKQTIYNLSNKLTYDGFDLDEKIREDNEQSLEAMLQDRSVNPMKVLPSLNRKHQWNMPGVREARKTEQQLLERGAAVASIESSTTTALPEID